MTDNFETQKVCSIIDNSTHIRYKIIYRKAADRYEIWTQFYDENGKLHRNRITFDEALAVEKDREKTIAYVKEFLVANHINIYEDKNPKPQNLNQLFKSWQMAQSQESDESWNLTRGSALNITKEHFRRDGIIDEDIFKKEDRKILFISSEANDDDYSAKTNASPSTIDDYKYYNKCRHDDWKGKMRERLSELYKVLSHKERSSLDNPDAALHFAVMDINKRGGGSLIGKDNHVEMYCKAYALYIREEIEIINPDVVAIIGTNLFTANLHGKYLGAITENNKDYFIINDKKVPILSLWQTSYYQGKCNVAKGYEDNKIIGKQVTRALQEMERYNL